VAAKMMTKDPATSQYTDNRRLFCQSRWNARLRHCQILDSRIFGCIDDSHIRLESGHEFPGESCGVRIRPDRSLSLQDFAKPNEHRRLCDGIASFDLQACGIVKSPDNSVQARNEDGSNDEG
jgi:hypothetical protein